MTWRTVVLSSVVLITACGVPAASTTAERFQVRHRQDLDSFVTVYVVWDSYMKRCFMITSRASGGVFVLQEQPAFCGAGRQE